jgi:hypothetical protein
MKQHPRELGSVDEMSLWDGLSYVSI